MGGIIVEYVRVCFWLGQNDKTVLVLCVCFFLVKIAKSRTYWNAAVLIIAIVGIVSRSLNCIHITEVTFGGVLVANDFKRFNEPL